MPAAVVITCLDPQATGYGTFQSHNQKVLANEHGIFMTHLHSRNEEFTAQQWRLSRSIDGGRSFATLLESTDATDPPVIESDEQDNLYLIRADLLSGDALFYRFDAARDFKEPAISRIPGGAAQKYAMLLDRQRKVIYFLGQNTTLYTIGLDGRVVRSIALLKNGTDSEPQYPQLALGSSGELHLAWTTVKTLAPRKWLYWTIHHVLSRDGGQAWQNLDGTKLSPPWACDQSGPAMRVTLNDEFQASTWLANMIVKGGKVHFLYLAATDPPRMHYVRYDIATAKRDIDDAHLRGDAIQVMSLDGFFTTRDDRADSPLYIVSHDGEGRIAALTSHDNGRTWHDHARSEQPYKPYAIGGCRRLAPDGSIVGSFTDDSGAAAPAFPKVEFLRIATAAAPR